MGPVFLCKGAKKRGELSLRASRAAVWGSVKTLEFLHFTQMNRIARFIFRPLTHFELVDESLC